MRAVRFSVAVLVIALSFACGSSSPSSPSSTPTTPTVSLSSLSPAAQAEFTVGAMIQRMRNNLVVTIRSSFSDVDTLAGANGVNGLNNWPARTGLKFVMVDSATKADIEITNELPELGVDLCGTAVPDGNPAIVGGKIRIAFGLKVGCDGGLRSIISHEIGHILGFGHSPEGQDEMSPHGIWGTPSPVLDEAAPWYYRAPLGAMITR